MLKIENVEQLELLQSQPDQDLIAELKKLEGDIMILGIGGKMGPTLGMLAVNAIREGGITKKVYGVSRFTNEMQREQLEASGVRTIGGDLMDDGFLQSLPKCRNVIFMVGNKFGTRYNEHFTWAMNSYLPGRVAEKFNSSSIVAFSSGNIYPFVSNESAGATEQTRPEPVGEYAQSCLGRERVFEYFSIRNNTPILIYRLNYAVELRYGVLFDIAKAVFDCLPVDITTNYVNVIWQGDANNYALRSLGHCSSPPRLLNITGPNKIEIKSVAETFGRKMNRQVQFVGSPKSKSLLNDASRAFKLLGKPKIELEQLIDWTAEWVMNGRENLGKPTHFQEREGKY